jgi:hypothetical protein
MHEDKGQSSEKAIHGINNGMQNKMQLGYFSS